MPACGVGECLGRSIYLCFFRARLGDTRCLAVRLIRGRFLVCGADNNISASSQKRIAAMVQGNRGKGIAERIVGPIQAAIQATMAQDRQTAALGEALDAAEWEQAAAMLLETPALLTQTAPHQVAALEHHSLPQFLPHASLLTLETVLICAPVHWRGLSATERDLVTQRLTKAASPLATVDFGSESLGEADITVLGSLARQRQLPVLAWHTLGLGDTGAACLLHALAETESGATGSGSAAAVTSLDLRDNGLTQLPVQLPLLKHLKELRLEGNVGLEAMLALQAEGGLAAVLDYLRDLYLARLLNSYVKYCV